MNRKGQPLKEVMLMIEYISEKTVAFLIDSNSISKDDYDEVAYYRYGVEITISTILNVVLIILLGLLFGQLFSSIIFLLCFVTLRQFTGGFHADTYLKCNSIFCAVYLTVLTAYYFTWQSLTVLPCVLIGAACIFIIYLNCPIENIHKKITPSQKVKLRYASVLFSSILCLLSVCMVVLSNKYGSLVLFTLSSVAALVIVAKIKERGR